MGRKGLFVMIDEDLLKRFREYVFEKHGKLHGAFSMEVENALKSYLEGEGLFTYTHKKHKIQTPKVYERLDRIIRWLHDNGFVKQFAWKDWEQAVINTVGADPRTVRKYLELAEKLGRIRHVVGNVWEFTR